MNTQTRKQQAFARFAAAHPRYRGGFLRDCFFDVACADMGIDVNAYPRVDPDDERWDRVAKEDSQ